MWEIIIILLLIFLLVAKIMRVVTAHKVKKENAELYESEVSAKSYDSCSTFNNYRMDLFEQFVRKSAGKDFLKWDTDIPILDHFTGVHVINVYFTDGTHKKFHISVRRDKADGQDVYHFSLPCKKKKVSKPKQVKNEDSVKPVDKVETEASKKAAAWFKDNTLKIYQAAKDQVYNIELKDDIADIGPELADVMVNSAIFSCVELDTEKNVIRVKTSNETI